MCFLSIAGILSRQSGLCVTMETMKILAITPQPPSGHSYGIHFKIPCSQVMAFTRFSENQTSDLEVKVTRIQTMHLLFLLVFDRQLCSQKGLTKPHAAFPLSFSQCTKAYEGQRSKTLKKASKRYSLVCFSFFAFEWPFILIASQKGF